MEARHAKTTRKDQLMNRYLAVFAALAITLMSSVFVQSLEAGESDKKTIITISQPLDVEGTISAAGKYVLTLLNPGSSRDVVYIFNGDGTRLVAPVPVIHVQRARPTAGNAFSFYGSTAGSLRLCIPGSIRATAAALSFRSPNTHPRRCRCKVNSRRS
jgi:hypothetical protein